MWIPRLPQQAGAAAGPEPRTPGSCLWGDGAVWACGAGLLLARASRWAAEEWAPRTLGGLWGEVGVPGARSQLWCPRAHRQGEACGSVCRTSATLGWRGMEKTLCLKSLHGWPIGRPTVHITAVPSWSCGVPTASKCPWEGGPRVQASCQPVRLLGLPGNRDRVGAGVGVGGQGAEWTAQAEGRARGPGGGRPSPGFSAREERTGLSRVLRGTPSA